MTPAQFEKAVNRTRLKDRARRMARAVLVEGVTASEAAKREGLTRQAADQAARSVQRQIASPNGWKVITVSLPPNLASQVRQLSALCKHHEELADEVADYLINITI